VTIDGITNPPNVLQPTLFFGRLEDIPSLRSAGGFRAIPNVIGVDQGGELPTVYTYSLSVQRNIGWSTAVDVAYVGRLGRHHARQRNLNSPPYGTAFSRAAQDPTQFTGGVIPTTQPNLPLAYSQAGINFTGQLALPVNFLRPFPGYGDIIYRSFDANSNYNALQVSVNRRFTNRLTFGIAYTWSKALMTANTETENTHPFNSRGYDYRLFDSDRTHVFVANYVYELPKLGHYLGDNGFARAVFDNWQISGLTQFVSGTPLELGLNIAGVDAGQRITGAHSAGGLSGQQPRLSIKSDPSKGPNGLLIDPNAFVIPALGSIGPYPRTYLRNPGLNNHDISIFKNIPLGGEGSRYLQLRFEFFNAFNHTQFSGINAGTSLVAPNSPAGVFGTPTDNAYSRAVITTNLRNGPVEGSSQPLGAFFGEYNGSREPRVIQLAVKVYS
jgi:hypothetical protein